MTNEEVEKYFKFAHLPEKLKVVSEPFGVLANLIIQTLPDCTQCGVALQKLVEAKDAAVRTLL